MFKSARKEELRVPAQIERLSDLREFVSHIGRKYHYSKKLINTFKLVVDEAATNIIKHSTSNLKNQITIRAIIRRESLTIVLVDNGTYFDPRWVKVPDLKKTVKFGERTGLGIFMMQRLIDKIDYQKTGAGNELYLTKYERNAYVPAAKRSVPSLPPLRERYFAYSIVLLTVIILSVFTFFYFNVHDRYRSDYLHSGKMVTSQLANQITSIKAEMLAGPDGINYINAVILPVYDEKLGQIYSVILEDTSDTVIWSTLSSEIGSQFERPESATQLSGNTYAYSLFDQTGIFEFEFDFANITRQSHYSRLHVLLSEDYIMTQIQNRRLFYIKVTLIGLGISYILLALISYIVTDPVRKLSKWIDATRQGDLPENLEVNADSNIGEIANAFTEITHKFKQSQKHLADHESFKKEITLAKDIQNSLLPNRLPELTGFELATCYQSAQSVGGDYYDFIEVDKDILGIVIADVSGKGVPGSLVMTMIRTALRTEARGITNAAEVLSRVNDFVVHDIRNGMFVTVLYLIINTKTNSLNFASAGHTPMILHRGSTDKIYYLNPLGFPIGIRLPQNNLFAEYIQAETIKLQRDDTILLYTDGVTEAMNRQRSLFGEERLLDFIRVNSKQPVNKFGEKLKTCILSFTEGFAQSDDITFVTIRCISEAPEQDNDDGDDQGSAVEHSFMSTEESALLLEAVHKHPEYDPEKMSSYMAELGQLLTAEKIEGELKRRRLHTVQLRQEYVDICVARNRRLNAPGTPQLKVDGSPVPPGERTDRKEPANPKQPEKTNMVPDIEADYIVGQFMDDILKSDEKVMDEPAGDDVVSRDDSNSGSGFDVPDISDSLVDKLVDDYFPEEKEEIQRIATEEIDYPAADAASEADSDSGPAQNPETDESEHELLPVTDDIRSDLPDESTEIIAEDSAESTVEEDEENTIIPHIIDEPFDADATDFAETEIGNSDETDEDSGQLMQDSGDETDTDTAETQPPIIAEEATDEKATQILEATTDEHQPATEPEIHFPETVSEETTGEQTTITSDDDTAGEVAGLLAAPEDTNESESRHLTTEDQHTGIPEEHPLAAETEDTVESDEHSTAEVASLFEEMLLQGIKHYKAQNYSAACKVFSQLTQISPDFHEAYQLLGNAYYRAGEMQLALIAYETYKKSIPADVAVRENLGLIYMKLGVLSLAVKEWKAILEMQPERYDIIRKLDRITKLLSKDPDQQQLTVESTSEVQITEGPDADPEQTIKTVTEYTEHEPPEHIQKELVQFRDELLQIGIEYYKKSEYGKSVEAFKTAIKTFPDFRECYRLLGNAYYRNDQYDEAAKVYTRLQKMADGTSLENMGYIHMRRGAYREAADQWNRALKKNPARGDIKRKLEKVKDLT